tara:strand:- start:1318 stop:1506 length:189 start_codon:yes stop_codon:yes gene_type:complete
MAILDYILYYLLFGTLIGLWIEHRIMVDDWGKVSWGERLYIVTLWPLMVGSFIYHFIKEILR